MKEFIINKSKLAKYTGTYMGIGFEINHWKDNSSHLEVLKDNWTYYLILHLDRIPEKYNPESFWLEGKKSGLTGNYISYDYYNHHIIPEIWMHHGCTFYNKESGFDGANKIINIGCDYQHYWDEGYTYDLSYIESDVKKSIEDLRDKMPDYKDISGIDITHKMLGKAGFEDDKICIYYGNIMLSQGNGGFDVFVNGLSNGIVCNIKYVHQLQNLIFALNNTPLNVQL